MIRHIQIVGLVLLVLMVASCSKGSSPTGPEIDPLAGTWYGRFVSSTAGESSEDNLVLVIRAGGAGTITGYYYYEIEQVAFVEQIYLEVEVDTNGELTGYGNWFASVFIEPPVHFADDAKIDGSLDSDNITGSGTITVGHGLYAMVINWSATKGSY